MMHTLTSKLRIGKLVQKIVALGMIVSLLAFPQAVLADYSIAQEIITIHSVTTGGAAGQSFTTLGAGWITQVDIHIHSIDDQFVELRIYPGAQEPDNISLALYRQEFTLDCAGCWASIRLTTPLAVNASTVYTFELITTRGLDIDGSAPNPYPGGSVWLEHMQYSNVDFAFRIWVAEIYPNPGPRCYVNQLATGENTGMDWANAYTDLQSALRSVGCTEIWVAKGTYKPTDGTARADSFVIPPGVKLFGGFLGTENQLSERAKYLTTLSGDIGKPVDASDNSYHVISVKNNGEALVTIDGFMITGGNANLGSNAEDNRGGGIYIVSSDVYLRNLIFMENFAFGGGGFFSNGGKQYLSNVVFYANTASMNGGGLHTFNKSTASLSNVTFWGNTSTGDTASGGIAIWDTSQVYLFNSILWGDKTDISPIFRDGIGGKMEIVASLVQKGCPAWATCQKVITSDPQFMGAAEGDLLLKSSSPAIDAGENSFVVEDRDDLDGDSDLLERLPYDLQGKPRILGTVDLGAYEIGANYFLPAILR